MIYDGSIIEKGGHRFRVNIERDDDADPPWKREDGHGPVSEWTRRDKRPGEWVLSSDRGSKRYYDAHEANEIAKRDSWGLGDDDKAELLRRLRRQRVTVPSGTARTARVILEPLAQPWSPLTRGEIRAESVRKDFEFLRRWCNDQWWYVGVVVTHLPDPEDDDEPIDYGHALWGIESDSDDYIEEVAHQHIDDILSDIAKVAESSEAAYWRERGVMTVPYSIEVTG
jgi:hypothetical protein